ncbi:MAG: hypothetical protein FJ363_08480 [Gemmatimonadetes bacterium]|nr:hypothetical protein [Gemmatimonadota bacterium]
MTVVFLRGVNVGGHRTFRPTEVVKRLAHLDVVNIGAAGTFVVRARIAQARVRAEFARVLPFATDIALVRDRDLLALLDGAHAAGHSSPRDVVRFVTVLCRQPTRTPSLPARFPARGQWLMQLIARDKRFVIGVYRRQMRAVSLLGEIDDLFGVPGTTRNWNTMEKIGAVLPAPTR